MAPTINKESLTPGTFQGNPVLFGYQTEDGAPRLCIHPLSGGDPFSFILCSDTITVTPSISSESTKDTSDASPNSFFIRYVVDAGADDSSTFAGRYQESLTTGLPAAYIEDNRPSSLFPYIPRRDKDPRAIIYTLVSTASGTYQATEFYSRVVQPTLSPVLPATSYNQELIFTDSERSIIEKASLILQRAQEGIPQLIILLSGDGGIVDILNVLLSPNAPISSPDTIPQSSHLSSPNRTRFATPTIALLPMGTGNALANSTGLNADQTKGLRQFFRGSPHPLPFFTAKFSPGSVLLTNEGRDVEPLPTMSNTDNSLDRPSNVTDPSHSTSSAGIGLLHGAVVCSWALHASLVADSDTPTYRRFGSERFSMAAKELLAPADGSAPHAYKGRITLYKASTQPGSTSSTEEAVVLPREEHGYVLATLVSNLEQNLTISPATKPLDGVLRVIHFGPLTAEKVMQIMGGAFQGGKHVESEEVGYEDVRGLRIDFEEDDDGDGASDGEGDGGRWRRVCVDGKIVRVPKGGWVEVRVGDHVGPREFAPQSEERRPGDGRHGQPIPLNIIADL